MKLQTLAIVFFSLLAFANCQSPESEQQTQQQTQQQKSPVEQGWDEIMKVHDEIMPISMKLPPIWEQLETMQKDVEIDESGTIPNMIESLKKSHKDMYDWMAESSVIRERLENATDDDLNIIIEEEKQRITKIKEETNAAYEAAQEYLKTEEK